MSDISTLEYEIAQKQAELARLRTDRNMGLWYIMQNRLDDDDIEVFIALAFHQVGREYYYHQFHIRFHEYRVAEIGYQFDLSGRLEGFVPTSRYDIESMYLSPVLMEECRTRFFKGT